MPEQLQVYVLKCVKCHSTNVTHQEGKSLQLVFSECRQCHEKHQWNLIRPANGRQYFVLIGHSEAWPPDYMRNKTQH